MIKESPVAGQVVKVSLLMKIKFFLVFNLPILLGLLSTLYLFIALIYYLVTKKRLGPKWLLWVAGILMFLLPWLIYLMKIFLFLGVYNHF